MIVGVPREIYPGERRVAIVPAAVPILMKGGFEVVVQAGAGNEAGYPDATYTAKGAKVVADRAEVFRLADIVVQVLCYGSNDKTGEADLPLLRVICACGSPFRSLSVGTSADVKRCGATRPLLLSGSAGDV